MENSTQNIEANEQISQASAATTAPKKRGRRKKNDSIKAIATKQETATPTNSTPVWFSVASNLALLIAIFTIVFAAHRGLQNNKNANVVVVEQQVATATVVADAAAVSATTENQKTTVAEATENNPTETVAPATEVAAAPVETEKSASTETAQNQNAPVQEVKPVAETKVEAPVAVSEPVAKVEAKPAAAKPVKKIVVKKDPYTDGGPLDLDRRENIVKRASAQMKSETKTANAAEKNPAETQTLAATPAHEVKKNTHLYTDINNPWNGRGDEDLDSPKNREQYKKSFIETGTSAK